MNKITPPHKPIKGELSSYASPLPHPPVSFPLNPPSHGEIGKYLRQIENLLTPFHIKKCHGPDIAPYLSQMKKLRLSTFREYPYLDESDASYEAAYEKVYGQGPHVSAVLAFDSQTQEMIGMATGNFLRDDMAEVQFPFLKSGWNINPLYYFGEIILAPQWRGQGIGSLFLKELERIAASHPSISAVTLCSVKRPPHHPARPEGYKSPHTLWRRCGFSPIPHFPAHMVWRDVGDSIPTEKPMTFWIKTLKKELL
jgi:GNAT superfamily N-acetyltransferase